MTTKDQARKSSKKTVGSESNRRRGKRSRFEVGGEREDPLGLCYPSHEPQLPDIPIGGHPGWTPPDSIKW